MRSSIFILFLSVLLFACSDDEVSIHPTPLVMNVRFDIPNASPNYVEKYFSNPMTKALISAPHVSITHAIATTGSATIVIFFEEGVKFAEGEDIIRSVIRSVNLPTKFSAVNFTELCGNDLSQSNLMHIARAKGIKSESVFDNVITVAEDLAENLLPKEEFDAMFSNECDEVETSSPLYVLDN